MAEKRSIFEEVGSGTTKDAVVTGGIIDAARKDGRGIIRYWLAILFSMVAVMIVVGGLTRLTDSGLSITEWKPIAGAVPPRSETAWAEVFAKYQATPEYRLQNEGMSLSEFKGIYWWEWGHRQLGRMIGLVWAVGFFWFLLRRLIPPGWTGRLLGIGVLGGLQGALGWWMVASGLTGRMVDVASYRLALHLGLAFIIMGLIAWYLFALARDGRELLQAQRNRETGAQSLASVLGLLVLAQILLGALVAGIDAGRGYIDWPLMNGAFLPGESFELTPVWSNFFENPALVQFNHRMFGYLVFIFAAFAWWKSRQSPLRQIKAAFNMVMAMVLLQMVLGIATVLYGAPWQVAIVHQIGAILLIVMVLRARFVSQYPVVQSLR